MKAALLRLALIPLMAFAVFAATRGLVRALPGSPLDTLVAETGTSLSPEAINEMFHLDCPYWQSLVEDTRNALHGNLGVSLITRQPITPLLLRRFGRTAELSAAALAIALALALLLAMPAAAGSPRADAICNFYGALSAALPTAWLGPMLSLALGVWVPLFPVGGSLFLPALTLGLAFSGLWARLIRDRMLEALRHPSAIAARARGIPEWTVRLKYGLVPCSGPLLAYLGTQAGALLAGAFVVEVVFDWRGMGSLMIDSVLRRDYPVIEASVFASGLATLLGTAVGDWLQSAVDPRLRDYEAEERETA